MQGLCIPIGDSLPQIEELLTIYLFASRPYPDCEVHSRTSAKTFSSALTKLLWHGRGNQREVHTYSKGKQYR